MPPLPPLRSIHFAIVLFSFSGGEQLDLGVLGQLIAGADHGLLDALLLVGLAVEHPPAEHLGVELDGLVEVVNGVADVVDADEEIVITHGSTLPHPRPPRGSNQQVPATEFVHLAGLLRPSRTGSR